MWNFLMSGIKIYSSFSYTLVPGNKEMGVDNKSWTMYVCTPSSPQKCGKCDLYIYVDLNSKKRRRRKKVYERQWMRDFKTERLRTSDLKSCLLCKHITFLPVAYFMAFILSPTPQPPLWRRRKRASEEASEMRKKIGGFVYTFFTWSLPSSRSIFVQTYSHTARTHTLDAIILLNAHMLCAK